MDKFLVKNVCFHPPDLYTFSLCIACLRWNIWLIDRSPINVENETQTSEERQTLFYHFSLTGATCCSSQTTNF